MTHPLTHSLTRVGTIASKKIEDVSVTKKHLKILSKSLGGLLLLDLVFVIIFVIVFDVKMLSQSLGGALLSDNLIANSLLESHLRQFTSGQVTSGELCENCLPHTACDKTILTYLLRSASPR